MLHMAWGQYRTPGPPDYTRYFKKSHPIPRDSPPRPGHLDPDDLVTPVFRRDVLPVIHKVRLGYYPPCVADCVPVLSIGFVSGSYTWNTLLGPFSAIFAKRRYRDSASIIGRKYPLSMSRGWLWLCAQLGLPQPKRREGLW